MTGEVKFSRIPARAAGMELTATDWAVLHVICLHADKAGQAYPSLARIAALARIRRNHVSRSTKRLDPPAQGHLAAARFVEKGGALLRRVLSQRFHEDRAFAHVRGLSISSAESRAGSRHRGWYLRTFSGHHGATRSRAPGSPTR